MPHRPYSHREKQTPPKQSPDLPLLDLLPRIRSFLDQSKRKQHLQGSLPHSCLFFQGLNLPGWIPHWGESGRYFGKSFSIPGFLSKRGAGIFFKFICLARYFPLSSVNLISEERDISIFSSATATLIPDLPQEVLSPRDAPPFPQTLSSEPSKERELSAVTGCGCPCDSCPLTGTKN